MLHLSCWLHRGEIWSGLAYVRDFRGKRCLRTFLTSAYRTKNAEILTFWYGTFWLVKFFAPDELRLILSGTNIKRVAKKLFSTRITLNWQKRYFRIIRAGCALQTRRKTTRASKMPVIERRTYFRQAETNFTRSNPPAQIKPRTR